MSDFTLILSGIAAKCGLSVLYLVIAYMRIRMILKSSAERLKVCSQISHDVLDALMFLHPRDKCVPAQNQTGE